VTERGHRGSIALEDGVVLAVERFAGDQFTMRIAAPECARRATPGSFAHVTCDALLPMRRPLSIMRADPAAGWIELLFKVLGSGLRLLAAHEPGAKLSVLGPIGNAFAAHPDRPRTVLIGGGVGIPPMVFLAETLIAGTQDAWRPLVFMGSEIPFPFHARPSTILVPGVPAHVIASMPLLDGWGVPSRLASGSDFPGCFRGFVTQLAATWLASLDGPARAEVEIFACGPTPMLAATAALAREFGVPCQVSLEEFMACAVGGCAGCAVRVATPAGPQMKRVCVDGPVFAAEAVFG
jgi:dihydroorotate dehydrogenase electron transfer subunit